MPTFQQLPFSIPFSVNKLASTTGNNKTQLRSPLEAAAQGDLTRLQQLWDQDFDFDLQSTPDGLRPLHYAASRGHLSIVKFLIDCCHVTVDIVDHEGETALLKAAYAGHFSVVEYLIIHAGANVLHEDKDGWSALHNACSYGDLDMVIFLIDHFLNVNLQSKMDHTPLINAASKGHLRIVQHLVYKANADLFIKNKFGETAYDAAAVAGEVYICEQLEKAERERIQDGYDLLRQHYTIPVILYENQQSVISLMTNSYIPSTWEKHQRIPWMLASSSSFLGDDDNNNQYMTKNQVRLPPLTDQQVWMWLTDWKIDYTHPNVDMDGWQYATHLDTPDENWSNKLPKSSTRRISYVRRRRWVRIMTRQRSSDIHDNNINDSDIETNHHPTTTTIIDLDATDDNSNAQEEHQNRTLDQWTNYQHCQEEASRPKSSTFITKTNATFVAGETIMDEEQQETTIVTRNESTRQGTARVWEKNEYALDCRCCGRWFNFVHRRHHCRQCGLVVCSRCSTKRVKLSFSGIIHDPQLSVDEMYKTSLQPQRICDDCFRHISRPLQQQECSTSNMDNTYCPVCGIQLITTIDEQEQHVQNCLNAGFSSSTSITRIGYVLYQAPPHWTLLGQECIICFDEFVEGDTIARLGCLCSYHHSCIHDWFSLGKGCPIHSQ